MLIDSRNSLPNSTVHHRHQPGRSGETAGDRAQVPDLAQEEGGADTSAMLAMLQGCTQAEPQTQAGALMQILQRLLAELERLLSQADSPGWARQGPSIQSQGPSGPGVQVGPSAAGQFTAGVPPKGYQAIKGRVSTEVGQVAKGLLGKPFGTMTPFEIDGKQYMARNEPHYHPPGFVGGPTGWHQGVTIYEART